MKRLAGWLREWWRDTQELEPHPWRFLALMLLWAVVVALVVLGGSWLFR